MSKYSHFQGSKNESIQDDLDRCMWIYVVSKP